MITELVVAVREPDEVGGDELRSLVDQLIERVLAVRSRLTPHDRAGLHAYGVALEVDGLPVALHVELLQVRREPLQVLVVRQDRLRLRAEEVVVPHADQAEDHRKVSLEGRGAEVLVDRVEAREHLPELLVADGEHER